MPPKIIIHNHYSAPARDSRRTRKTRDGFSPGQRATFKGMAVKVKGPGPSEGQVEVERISNGKTLVVSESLLK